MEAQRDKGTEGRSVEAAEGRVWHPVLIRRKEAQLLLGLPGGQHDKFFDWLAGAVPGFCVRFRPGGYRMYVRDRVVAVAAVLSGVRYGRRRRVEGWLAEKVRN